MSISLHQYIDFDYPQYGDVILKQHLQDGFDPEIFGNRENLLHVAARRRRLNTMKILLDHGANIDAKNGLDAVLMK